MEKIFNEREYDSGNKHSVPYLYGSFGLAYNKEKVGTLTIYAGLWNPEFKGYVTVQK
ncbi:ABC transporter substrate-binding protein [Psychrobacillus sp. L3]|uniref:ABC transporter substrate-binding protein n=1 Tax=Psychrobacillus sp. L3 TaxID=3236891 RepID=UPI0036F37765